MVGMGTPLPERFLCPECCSDDGLMFFVKSEAGCRFKVWLECVSCSWETRSYPGNYSNDENPTSVAKRVGKSRAKIR